MKENIGNRPYDPATWPIRPDLLFSSVSSQPPLSLHTILILSLSSTRKCWSQLLRGTVKSHRTNQNIVGALSRPVRRILLPIAGPGGSNRDLGGRGLEGGGDQSALNCTSSPQFYANCCYISFFFLPS